MIERIDSPANKKIKLAAALKQRKQREKTGLFVAEGIRLCEMAAEAGWQVKFGLLTSRRKQCLLRRQVQKRRREFCSSWDKKIPPCRK